MPRTVKWLVTILCGATLFAGGWWVLGRLGLSRGDAIGIAAIPSALLILPLAWWAGRESSRPDPVQPAVTGSHNTVIGSATGIIQARDIHGDVHVHPVQPRPVEGQVVVGLIPCEPPNFQLPDQIVTLAGMSGAVCVICAVTGQRGVGKPNWPPPTPASEPVTAGWSPGPPPSR